LESYFPESVLVFKKIDDNQPLYKPEIEEFYRLHQIDIYVCDSSRRSLHENFENITINIERVLFIIDERTEDLTIICQRLGN